MSPIIRFTFLALQLTHLLDEGRQLDLQETLDHIRRGDLFSWLGATLPFPHLDLGFYDGPDGVAVMEMFTSLEDAYGTSKFGISHNGLVLLLAYSIEGVQQTALP